MTAKDNSTSGNVQLDVNQEIDLLEYLRALLNAKYRILLIAVLGAGIVFGLSKLVTDVYSSSALLAINLNEEPGGIKPKDFRGNNMIGLIERDFMIGPVADNQKERLLARINSATFAEIFIEEKNLFEYIFKDDFDTSSGRWNDGFQPNMGDAVAYFHGEMLWVSEDIETGLLNVGFKTHNPKLSADLANSFWKEFNEYIKQIERSELDRRRVFLEDKIETISNIELQRSIYRLMESQIAAESLLNSREKYPLEEIQPARVPKYKSYPNRKAWSVGALVGLVLLGSFFTLAMVVLKKISTALRGHGGVANDNPLQNNSQRLQPTPEETSGGSSFEKVEKPRQTRTETTDKLKSEYDDWIE